MSYTSLSVWKQRLKAGEPPIATTEEWQSIHRALQKHHHNKQHYTLSTETGLLEIDSSVLLSDEPSDQEDIKVFNEFNGNLRAVATKVMHKASVTVEAAQILKCMKTVRHISIKVLEHNKQGYKCSFTGELDPTNVLIQIVYYTDNQWRKSPVFSVTERYALWLQAVYMMQTFTTVLLQHIEQPPADFFTKMNAAIQVAWEFVYPVISAS